VYFTCERMLDNQQIKELEARGCIDKLLFGSGYPNRPHTGALGLVLYANIQRENREKILSKNWEAMV
jgi:predicted TIM-barrel fold metal-dependent hydrolase